MKHFLTLILTLGSSITMAENRMDQMEAYREIQRLIHVEDKVRDALNLANELLPQLDKNGALYRELTDLVKKNGNGNPHFPLAEAIKFMTGVKEEIYCKDFGLVHMRGKHNNGTESSIKLISSNRKIKGYSIIKDGDWVYELDTAYREPVNSESWLIESTDNSYQFQEIRHRVEGEVDKGKWTAYWKEDSNNYSYNTSGNTPEPMPVFLANDYHLWGTYDLGFRINFKVGAKDSISNIATGSTKRIILKTDREVLQKMDNFEYQDGKGKSYSYQDCYKVKSIINLDRLEELKKGKRKRAKKGKLGKKGKQAKDKNL